MPDDFSKDQWKILSDLFDQILALKNAEREQFFATLPPEHRPLESELRSLLAHAEVSETFLESPPLTKLARVLSPLPMLKDGDKIDDFVIHRKLGEGSFGCVYLAHQLSLHREIALKLTPNLGNEATTMATFEHDHIVRVFSETIDSKKNLRLICMQYVPGTTLDRVLEKLKLPTGGRDYLATIPSTEESPIASMDWLELTLSLGIQLASALCAAHAKQILHLDVKPGNILVHTSGRLFLTDFNISQTQESKPSAETLFGGTRLFMAPEHEAALIARDEKQFLLLDERADVYALGKVLQQFFSIGAPSRFQNEAVALQRVLAKATAEKREERYASAQDFQNVLSGLRESISILKRLPPQTRFGHWGERFPALVLATTIVVPQVIGSVINIAYNKIRIVDNLLPAQRNLFLSIVPPWNIFVFSACGALLFSKVFYALRSFSLSSDPSRDLVLQAEARQRLMRLPFWIVVSSTLGWGTASILFPVALHFGAGKLSWDLVLHFQISFFFAWLVPTVYSYVNAHFFLIRVLYPHYWQGETQLVKKAREELGSGMDRMRSMILLTALAPLSGALLMLFLDFRGLDAVNFQIFRLLLGLFILLSVVGIFYTVRVSRQLLAIYQAWTE